MPEAPEAAALGALHRRWLHRPEVPQAPVEALDWAHEPPAAKVWPDPPPPGEWAGPGLSGPAAVLAALLTTALGATARHEASGTVLRAVPSAGARYPVEAYLVCGDMPGMAAGVHHLDPLRRTLRRIRDGNLRAEVARAADVADGLAEACVILTACPARTVWKYGAGGYRQVLWDTGAALATLGLVAESLDLATSGQLAFDDDAVNRLLGLHSEAAAGGEVALALLHLFPTTPPPEPVDGPVTVDGVPAGDLAAVQAREGPSRSARSVDQVLAHRLGTLAAGEVTAWRRAVGQVAGSRGWPAAPLPPTGEALTREQVAAALGRRRSVPTYASSPLPISAVEAAMGAAVNPPPCDSGQLAATVDAYVLVHDVQGVPSGVHAWSHGGLRARRSGSFRRAAVHLCQRQPAAGSGGALVLLSLDVDASLRLGGARGYRAAQVEVGAAAARAHLSGTVSGVATTILTVFEEEAQEALGISVQPQLAVALGSLPPRPGRHGRAVPH